MKPDEGQLGRKAVAVRSSPDLLKNPVLQLAFGYAFVEHENTLEVWDDDGVYVESPVGCAPQLSVTLD